jgi:hypothetical protein
MSLPAFSLLLFALAVPLPAPLTIAASALAGGCIEVFTVNWATTPSSKYRQTSSRAFPPCGDAKIRPNYAA